MSSVNTRRALKQFQTKILNLTLSTIIGLSGLVAAAPVFFSGTASAVGPSAVFVRQLGDDANCDGTVNADYPGSGTAQACAFKTIGVAVTAVAPSGTVTVAAGT